MKKERETGYKEKRERDRDRVREQSLTRYSKFPIELEICINIAQVAQGCSLNALPQFWSSS